MTISFNQGRFLEQAIQSVVDQRRPGLDIEFVVVDAGSTDNSPEILKAYSDHIDIVIEEPDDGPPDGLNKGFALTTGEVLGFLNADDWLEPGSLAVVADFFRRSAEFDAVVGSLEILDERSGITRLVRIPPPFTALRFVEDRTTVLQQATFFRRSAWDATTGFNTRNLTCWDTELFVDMLLSGVRFGRLPEVLGGFRLHSGSITGSRSGSDPYYDDMERLRNQVRIEADTRNRALVERVLRLGWKARPATRLREARIGRKRKRL